LPSCFLNKITVAIKGLCMINEQFLQTIPQYGIGGFVKKIFKKVKDTVKKVAPIAGAGIGFLIGGAAGAGIGSGIGSLIAGKSPEEALKNAALGYGIGSLAGVTPGLRGFAGKGLPFTPGYGTDTGGFGAMGDKYNLFNMFTGGGTEDKITKLQEQNILLDEAAVAGNKQAVDQIAINNKAIENLKVNEIIKSGGTIGGGKLGTALTTASLALPVASYFDAQQAQKDFVPPDPMGLNPLYYGDPQAYQVANLGVDPYYYTNLQEQFGAPVEDLPTNFLRAAQGGSVRRRESGSSLFGEFSGSPHRDGEMDGPFYKGEDKGTFSQIPLEEMQVPYDQMQKDQMMGYLMMQFSNDPSAFEQRYGNEMAEFFREMMGYKTKDQLEKETGAIFDENTSEIIGYNLAQGGTVKLSDGSEKYFPRKNGQIDGPGTGTSDDIPAMLSDGEFVFTAKAVRNAGGGDRREGAKRMYQVMKNLEKGGNLSMQSRGVA
jgi:hypothetical protein